MASKEEKMDIRNAKKSASNRFVKGRAAKELTKISKVGTKISRTNSNFKPPVALKPGTPKANATATNKSKVALTKKYNAIEAKRVAMQRDGKGVQVLRSQGVKNKMKAQGAKSMLSPTSSALERAKAKNKK